MASPCDLQINRKSNVKEYIENIFFLSAKVSMYIALVPEVLKSTL